MSAFADYVEAKLSGFAHPRHSIAGLVERRIRELRFAIEGYEVKEREFLRDLDEVRSMIRHSREMQQEIIRECADRGIELNLKEESKA